MSVFYLLDFQLGLSNTVIFSLPNLSQENHSSNVCLSQHSQYGAFFVHILPIPVTFFVLSFKFNLNFYIVRNLLLFLPKSVWLSEENGILFLVLFVDPI